MSIPTKTLKLPFLRLNRAKAAECARLQALNTATANAILALPKAQRRRLTSKACAHVAIGSAWIKQTMRNANARTQVKQLQCLPLETNNQHWTLHKVGDTYSIAFGLRRGITKRLPLAVHHVSHQPWLDAVLAGRTSPGTVKPWRSRTGLWYACLSVSMEVPDVEPTGCWMGMDRGQNMPVAAATPDGPVIFWKATRLRHIRRLYASRRQQLQAAGKHRAVKKLGRTVCRQSEARNRSPHGRASARSVSGHHAHHHQGATPDR